MKKVIILKIILSGILLIVLVQFIDFGKITEAFHRVRGRFLWIAAVLLIPNLLVQWYKWHYLIRLKFKTVPFWESFSSLIIGISLGLVTPGRTGEYARAWFLPYDQKAQLFGYTVIDKIYNQITLTILGLFSLLSCFYSTLSGSLFLLGTLWLLFICFVVIIILALINPQRLYAALKNSSRSFLKRQVIQRMITGFAPINRAVSIRIFLLSGILFFIVIIQYYTITLSFGKVPFPEGVRALTAAMFCTMLVPLFFGNLGIRELSAVVFLRHAGLSPEAAFDSSIILFTINILIPALFGYGILLIRKTTKKR